MRARAGMVKATPLRLRGAGHRQSCHCVEDRQYVLIAAGGPEKPGTKRGDELVAVALEKWATGLAANRDWMPGNPAFREGGPAMRICVYSGSNSGARGCYRDAATAFGTALAEDGIGLVYGGASIGLMGAVADAVLANGGEAIGVIPEALKDVEIAHPRLTDLRIVSSMHERKATMAELADAFVALPGGIGTFEELFEAWTWSQLGVHSKPCALLNIAGFYDRLAEFLDHVAAEKFLRPVHRDILIVEDDPNDLLQKIRGARVPVARKWFDMDRA